MSEESFSLYFNHKMDCWIKLIPAVTLIVISAYFSPPFVLACACTSLLLSLNLTIIYIGLLFITPKFKKEYYDAFFNQQLTITLEAPIIEECLFRGIILQVLLSCLALVCPSTIIFPFLNLSIAAFCAILVSSLLFGLAHISNAEDQNHFQVLCTFLLGLVIGYLYLQFGLFTAIGAHIFNNTLACIIIYSQLEIVQAQGFYAPGYS